MAFGFKSINDFGQVIISDEIQTLHFAGEATEISDDNGAFNDFPGYGGPNDTLDGRVLITYRITTPGIPLAFIKPTDYSRWACIVQQSQAGNVWTFVVMMSGTSTAGFPKLYCFVDANEVVVPSSEGFGMIVYKADGSKTFDSRVQPLAVVDGGVSRPQTLPADDGEPGITSHHFWNYATLDFDFRSNNTYTANTLTTGVSHTNLMYAAPSLAQAVYTRKAVGYKVSCSSIFGRKYNCQDHDSVAAWWVMYRNAFRLQSGEFQSGWGTYEAGYEFISRFETAGYLNNPDTVVQFGSQPYQPKTINLTSNAFIIADSTGY